MPRDNPSTWHSSLRLRDVPAFVIYFSCLRLLFLSEESGKVGRREEWKVETTFSSTFLMKTTSYVLPLRSFIFGISLAERANEDDTCNSPAMNVRRGDRERKKRE